MYKVLLGYPGSGLKAGIASAVDLSTVEWVETLTDEALAGVPDTVLYVGGLLTAENLAYCKEAKLAATVIYPAPTAIGEYPNRWQADGYSAGDIANYSVDLSAIRADTVRANRHVVLGRGETVDLALIGQ